MWVFKRLSSSLSDSRVRRRACLIAAVLVTIYGGLLRFEALIVSYGWMGQPWWSEQVARQTMPVVSHLRPQGKGWTRIENPYVGGDPINYLRYAREMSHFYQGHVREPMFLAITRGFLWLSGNQDIALSYASGASATLAIFATYLLGAAAVSPGVGLAAAFALAVEFIAVARSVDGWRDDTFMLFVALTSWCLVKLRQRPMLMWGGVTGIAAAGAALTRISAISFVLPALLWLLVETRRDRKAWKSIVLAALVCSALTAPYLVNCALLTGDPFYAINYHTRYYRFAELLPEDTSVSALSYLADKVRSHPIKTADTIAQGLITFPLMNKWDGYQEWSEAAGLTLFWCATAGLFLALWSATGRFLLMILIMSLVPYAATWSIGGGGDWRFTQHAYPFYLVFAFSTIAWACRTVITFARDESARRSMLTWRVAFRVATLVSAIGVWALGYVMLPRAMYREALAAGEAVNIPASERDEWLLEGSWSDPIPTGNVIARLALAEHVAVGLPMSTHTDYWLTLRLDPAETPDPARQPYISVFLNRRALAVLRLTRNPERVGTYRVRVPKDTVRGWNRLDLVASHTVPAGEAGVHFATLPADTPVAFRFWYVRLDPH
jgi:4-amino-4-deoxy-L-arabinose transferase-like glycosyltransferase